MYTLQYSYITHAGSSNRCVHGGMIPEGYQAQGLYDWLRGKCSLHCSVKSGSGLVYSEKISNTSKTSTEYLSLKKLSNLWMKRMLSHRVSLTRSIVPKSAAALFIKAIFRTLYHIVREWWGRSYRPGSNEGFIGSAEVDLADYQTLVSRISTQPQFHMGADPILMSAIWWQGCHFSNHGGN
jgi:hypothetical protein